MAKMQIATETVDPIIMICPDDRLHTDWQKANIALFQYGCGETMHILYGQLFYWFRLFYPLEICNFPSLNALVGNMQASGLYGKHHTLFCMIWSRGDKNYIHHNWKRCSRMGVTERYTLMGLGVTFFCSAKVHFAHDLHFSC